MFLNRLNREEKVAFLKLAHFVARIDGDFSEKQQEIISGYCVEMQISDIPFSENDFVFVDVLRTFNSNESQRIVLMEIMTLVFSDEFYHHKERVVIDQMIAVFNLNDSEAKIFAEWSKALLALARQGELLVKA